MNKKGQFMGILILVGALFIILIGGLALVFGGVIIDWVFDEAVPEITTIGIVGSSNISEYTTYGLTPVNNFVQSFTWMSGVVYVLSLLAVFGLAIGFRVTGNKWLMGFFIGCMLLLVIASIFISNIYEEFYNGTGEIASRLKEHELISYLILFSPVIMSLMGIIGGIIMFTGNPEEAYGY